MCYNYTMISPSDTLLIKEEGADVDARRKQRSSHLWTQSSDAHIGVVKMLYPQNIEHIRNKL